MEENINNPAPVVTPVNQASITPPPETQANPKKKLFIIGGIISGIILILIILFFVLANGQKKETAVVTPTPTPAKKAQNITKAPLFKARTYTYSGNLPAKQNHFTYTIAPFTKSNADTIASKLGVTSFNEKGDSENYEYSTTNDDSKRGTLVFNKESGTFSYESYGTFTPSSSTPSASVTQNTIELLKNLEIYDESIDCNITYEDTQKPGVKFVECHRNWSTLSAPFLNLGGVLNLPEQIKITSLQPGQVSPTMSLSNPTITNVSTGGNGLARPNEFNTITVGMYDNGQLYSIDSKMRKIEGKTQVPESDIMTSQEAYNAFIQGKGEMALTVPAGSGTVDYARVYPDNLAVTEIAAISEMTPAYLDKPFSAKQNAYEPYYLIRGTARLDSGYTVRFAQAIPALKSRLTTKPQEISSENNIQILTFTRTPTRPEPTKANKSNPEPTLAPALGCQLISTSMTQGGQIDVPGYGVVNLAYINTFGTRTYSFATIGKEIPSPETVNAVKDAYFKALGKSFAIYSAKTANQIEILKVKQNAAICPATRNGSCYNKVNESKALKAMEEAFSRYSDEELKSMQYPVSIETILDDDKYAGSSPSQLLSWLFTDGYERQQYKTDKPGTFGSYCYISGNSPHIFINSTKKQNVTITSNAILTYSDPRATANTWEGTVEKRMFTNNLNQSRSSIYYEYNPETVRFTESEKGFIVSRNEIESFILSISNKLGLTKNESSALLSDTLLAISKLKSSPYLKISFIDPDEVETQLPLSVSPKPAVTSRIHLLISPINKNKNIQNPEIKKVERSEYSILELGAYPKTH